MNLMTTYQAAKLLGVSTRTVQRMVSTGVIAPLFTTSVGHLFEPSDVARLKQERAA